MPPSVVPPDPITTPPGARPPSPARAADSTTALRPIRVLVVDDSRVFRRAVTDALAGEPDLLVVAQKTDGREALDYLRANPVDVVTLDVEMPGMDGLETLRGIRELNAAKAKGSEIGVIMLSAVTVAGAEATVTALIGGAFDFITKPTAAAGGDPMALLRGHLAMRIRAWAAHARPRPHGPDRTGGGGNRIGSGVSGTMARMPATPPVAPRQRRAGPVQAVVIGVSTGGPTALIQMLPGLCRRIELPVLIVQHMPPNFTASLAQSLARVCSHRVAEGVDGQPLEPRTVAIAPGGRHLTVSRRPEGRQVHLAIGDQPPENGLRPAADVLFRSAAAVWGGGVVAVVLTGMGSDGTRGLAPLRQAGAPVIVQDEETSVVWGMPGSAVQAGLVDEVLPLMDIPDAVARAVRGV